MIKHIDQLLNKFIKNFTFKNGVISENYPPTNKSISNDLDDILPFLIYFNRQNYVEDQIEKILVCSGIDQVKNKRDVVLWRYDEWIGGLFLSEHKTHIQSGNKLLRQILTRNSSKDYLYPSYDLKNKNNIFKYFTPRAYGIFEVIFENKDKIDDEIYNEFYNLFEATLVNINLNKCVYVMDKPGLDMMTYDRRISLLNSYYTNTGFKRALKISLIKILDFRFVKTMKDSSNFLFSFLEYLKLSELNKSNHKDLFVKLLSNLTLENPVKTFNNKSSSSYQVCHNTAAIELICDYYYFIDKNEELLNRALNISNYFIKYFKKKKYLTRNDKSKEVFVDEVIDFSIALKKLSELKNNNKISSLAKDIYQSSKVHLNLSKGFVYQFYNIESKKLRRVSPKYSFLFMKGVITFELLEDEKIYENSKLFNLLKDR